MSWETDTSRTHFTEIPDNRKNDYQNARKRTLHGWSVWRTKVNNKLCKTTLQGKPLPRKLAPIDKFLKKTLPPNHPAQNPGTLMSFSAAQDSMSDLKKNNYIIYGLPRVKLGQKRPGQVPISHSDPELDARIGSNDSGVHDVTRRRPGNQDSRDRHLSPRTSSGYGSWGHGLAFIPEGEAPSGDPKRVCEGYLMMQSHGDLSGMRVDKDTAAISRSMGQLSVMDYNYFVDAEEEEEKEEKPLPRTSGQFILKPAKPDSKMRKK